MQDYWQQLTTREKVLVTFGVCLSILFVLYLLILKPMFSDLEQLKNEIREQSALLTWMQATAVDIKTLKSSEPDNPVFSDSSMISIVEITLNQGPLQSVSKQVRQNNTQVSVQFKSVPTLILLNWLSELWQQHRIQVAKLDLIRTEPIGTVRADIQLSRHSSH